MSSEKSLALGGWCGSNSVYLNRTAVVFGKIIAVWILSSWSQSKHTECQHSNADHIVVIWWRTYIECFIFARPKEYKVLDCPSWKIFVNCTYEGTARGQLTGFSITCSHQGEEMAPCLALGIWYIQIPISIFYLVAIRWRPGSQLGSHGWEVSSSGRHVEMQILVFPCEDLSPAPVPIPQDLCLQYPCLLWVPVPPTTVPV